jgi:hypothetical protein
MHHGPVSSILFAIGENDDEKTCVFSRGCCKVNGTAIEDVSGIQHVYYALIVIPIWRAAFAL